MNTLELKSELHRMIVETNDSGILEQVKSYFTGLTSEKDWYADLTEQQKASIQQGMEDAKAGVGISHAEMQQRIQKIKEKYTAS